MNRNYKYPIGIVCEFGILLNYPIGVVGKFGYFINYLYCFLNVKKLTSKSGIRILLRIFQESRQIRRSTFVSNMISWKHLNLENAEIMSYGWSSQRTSAFNAIIALNIFLKLKSFSCKIKFKHFSFKDIHIKTLINYPWIVVKFNANFFSSNYKFNLHHFMW